MDNKIKRREKAKEEVVHLEKNYISVCGIEIGSANEPLEKIEIIINRLIDRNKDFILMRRETAMKTGFAG